MILRRLRGLRVQLLLWTILPLAVVLIVLSLAGVFRHRQAMTQLVEERDRSVALAEANDLARQIQRRASMLSAAGHMVDLGGDSETAQRALQELASRLAGSYGGGFALLESDGSLLAASDAAEWAQSGLVADLAHQVAATGGPAFTGSTQTGAAPRLLIAVTAAPERILVAGMPTASLAFAESEDPIPSEMRGAAFLVDTEGNVVWASNPHNLNFSLREVLARAADLQGDADVTRVGSPDHGDLVVSYASVDPPGWTLVFAEDLAGIEAMGISFVEALPMVLLFVAVVALLAVSFGVANVVRPLQELDRRAARVAWGDFEAVDTPVGGVQEVDDLRVTLAQMAERIRSYQSGMRDYLSAVTLAQEEERARLAHELHDDTVQALIALKQRGQMAHKALSPAASSGQGPDVERASKRLGELNNLIDRELAGLRRLIADLRPIYLEDLGFVAALEMLAKQVGQQHDLAINLQVQGEPARLAPDLELAAYRIVQQALRNVVSHAAAEHVDLAAAFSDDGLTLTVSDDGSGFTPPEQPADLARDGHFGLMGMRERAMLYGGHLHVNSSPGHGTTITAWLPIC